MLDIAGLPVFEAVTGLVFLFVVLSTVASAVNEGIANVLGWRSKTLEDAVRGLLGDPAVKRGWQEWMGRMDTGAAAPDDLSSNVFRHWRITTLVRDRDSGWRRRRMPSYLPPKAFSLAVAESVAKRAPVEAPSPWQELDDRIFSLARAGLEEMPEGGGRELLWKAAMNAEDRLERFRMHLETGFDDAMERASGWYKRKVQFSLLVIAIAITLIFNVDSYRVGERLWSNPTTRAAVASAAAEHAGSARGAAEATAAIEELRLPIGWSGPNAPDDLGDVVARIPGWFLTIAGISLGAPFWFDLLSRVARLRGTGRPEPPRSLSDKPGTEPAPATEASSGSSDPPRPPTPRD